MPLENTPEALAEGREWLRMTLASIGEAVITTDTQGIVTFVNPVAEAVTGWTAAEAMGRPLDEVFPVADDEQRRPLESPVTRALRDGPVVNLGGHTVLTTRGGEERLIEDNAAPIRNPRDEVVGVVILFRDVTERRHTEQSLRQSEERFRLLVSAVRDYAIFMLDERGYVSSWNPGAERIKGYVADEIIGKHFSVFYPKEAIDADWPAAELRAATADGRFEDEGWRLRKDGTRFWANVVITALKDKSGKLLGFSKITRDLTERRRVESALRASEARYRRLFEASSDGLVIVDAKTGDIFDANPRFSLLVSWPHEDLVAKKLWQVGLFAGPKAYQEALASVRERGHVRHEDVALETTEGKRMELEIVGTLFDVDERRVVQFAVRDVSQRRQLERATIHAEAMEELNRRKDEFLAMLSHELRNPLAAVVNAVHMQKLSGDPDPVRRRAQEIIERQIGRLTHLVDDLLEVSRITTGRVQLHQEFVDMRVPVEHGVDSLRPSIESREQTIELSLPGEPVWIFADPGRVEQVVVNLLHNAVKYTNRGGALAVSVAREGEEAVLRVRDNGAGISAQLLPRIFDLFTQAERTLDRAEGGLGVGLTVVQRVVHLHGGRVEARSEGVNRGSEFVVRLPVVVPPEPEGLETPSREALSRPLRILVVDDNRDAADSMVLLLRRSHHEVRVEYTGSAVKAAALEFLPDVVLLDLGLPGLDGYQVAAELRADPRLASIRLIAVSGYGQDADKKRSKEAGFFAHLVKPVDLVQLRDTLAAITGRPLRP